MDTPFEENDIIKFIMKEMLKYAFESCVVASLKYKNLLSFTENSTDWTGIEKTFWQKNCPL